jgi:hypothetical protein
VNFFSESNETNNTHQDHFGCTDGNRMKENRVHAHRDHLPPDHGTHTTVRDYPIRSEIAFEFTHTCGRYQLRGKLTLPVFLPGGEFDAGIRAHPEFAQLAGDKQLRKVIAVFGKIIKLVVG